MVTAGRPHCKQLVLGSSLKVYMSVATPDAHTTIECGTSVSNACMGGDIVIDRPASVMLHS